MRALLIAVAASLAVAAPAYAQVAATAPVTADRLAAAREVIELSRVRDLTGKQMTEMTGKMLDAITKQIAAKSNTSDPYASQRVARAMAVYKTEMGSMMQDLMPKMIDAMVTIYARDFTIGELHGLSAFYRSPVGQAYATKLPAVTSDMMATMSDSVMRPMMERMPAIMKKMEAAVAEPPPAPKAK